MKGIKIMNIETFIAQMNSDHKEGVVQKHIVRKYVPLEEKIAEAKNIIEMSCYKEIVDSDGKIQKTFWVDSNKQHFLTVLALIRMYTDLTLSENPLADYNLLAENDYEDIIMKALPNKDAMTFMGIVDNVYDDEYENVNSIQGRIKNLIFGFDNIMQNVIANIASEQTDGGKVNEQEVEGVKET